MIEAIIFDMDGVLVDSEPINSEIEKRQFLLNNLSISEEEHQQYLGVSSEKMWKEIAQKHELNLPVDRLIEQNKTESLRYFSELDEIPVMPGLINFLKKLQDKNFPMAVASSADPEIIEIILNKTGIRKYFQETVSAKEAGKSKPEPDIFFLAAQKLGANPNFCLVIEDSENGIEAAHRARMRVIAYQGPNANPAKQKEADAVVKSYQQLEMFIKD
ncbi:MAG: HAD family phosphatase [Prolixibacteraceae bacterium]